METGSNFQPTCHEVSLNALVGMMHFFSGAINSYDSATCWIQPTNEVVIICVWFVQSQLEEKLQLHWRHHGWIELPKQIWRND